MSGPWWKARLFFFKVSGDCGFFMNWILDCFLSRLLRGESLNVGL